MISNPATTKDTLSSTPPKMSAPALVRYKFIFFTPPQYLSEIKAAVFATGAGTFPNYTECCFTTLGKGQFRPGDAANPAVGKKEQLEEVEEVRCEMFCPGCEGVERAIEALKR